MPKHFPGRSDSAEGFCDMMHTRGVYEELVFGEWLNRSNIGDGGDNPVYSLNIGQMTLIHVTDPCSVL